MTRSKAQDAWLTHELIKTGDADVFPQICDSNGDVVLAYCRRCRGGEIDLYEPCVDRPTDRIRELEADAKRLEFMALNGFALSSLTRDGVRFFRASVAHTWVHDWRLAIDHAITPEVSNG